MGYSNKTFACPFFRWDERLCIHCEGGKLPFHDRQMATEYIDRHCGAVDGWSGCTLAQALLQYYDRTEEKQ